MRTTTTLMAALLALAALAGCQPKQDTGVPGPAQQAGKAVDEAGARVAKSLHAPIDKAEEAKRKMAEAGEQARKDIADATEDARAGLNDATKEVGKKVERVGEKMQNSAN
jgi:Spy/CpxP family protein refolding chaperone